MTSLLLKLFVKDRHNIQNPKVRASYGALAGTVGIITNLMIAALKLVIGLLASSVSVIADASNNFSDAGSSLITLVGFRLSEKPADREHPFGHARYEYVTGLIVSFIVTLLGGTFLIDSVKKIVSGEGSEYGWTMIVLLSVTVAVKLWQSFFYKKLSKAIRSDSLKASSADSRNDAVMTGVVIIGAVINKLTSVALDGWFGAFVAVFVLISGIRLIIETVNPILGIAPDPETVKKIADKVTSYEGVIGIHDLIVHSYGAGKVFASIHAEVPANRDIMKSHDIIDNIEEDILKEMGVFLVIHMDPVTVGDERIDAMKEALSEIIRNISPDLKFHDFRVVFGPTHNNVLFDVVIPFDGEFDEATVTSRIISEFKFLFPNSVVKPKVERNYTE